VELSSGEGADPTTATSGGHQEEKTKGDPAAALPDISKFLLDPGFQYVDFAQRDRQNAYPTFRIQVGPPHATTM
jgi:hypothetical protein